MPPHYPQLSKPNAPIYDIPGFFEILMREVHDNAIQLDECKPLVDKFELKVTKENLILTYKGQEQYQIQWNINDKQHQVTDIKNNGAAVIECPDKQNEILGKLFALYLQAKFLEQRKLMAGLGAADKGMVKKAAEKAAAEKVAAEKAAAEKLNTSLETPKTKLENLLADLQSVQTSLEKRQTDSDYKEVLQSVKNLHQTLTDQTKAFFAKPTLKAFSTFEQKCKDAIDSTMKESEKHRGFGGWDPVARIILGVLAVITVIPACIVSSYSKNGCMQTFFASPRTNTAEQMDKIKEEFHAQTKQVQLALSA